MIDNHARSKAPDEPETLAKVQIRNPPVKELSKQKVPKQGVLDLDGISALRQMDEITGLWLVTDATLKGAQMVEHACLANANYSEIDQARVRRWFEIAESLRSQRYRSIQKAHARRAHIAEVIGVSQEQVRQIDQGRYVPLNKVLTKIRPKDIV